MGMPLKGMRPQHVQLRVGGRRMSAVPVLTTRGIEDVYVTKDTRNLWTLFADVCCQSSSHMMGIILVQLQY